MQKLPFAVRSALTTAAVSREQAIRAELTYRAKTGKASEAWVCYTREQLIAEQEALLAGIESILESH